MLVVAVTAAGALSIDCRSQSSRLVLLWRRGDDVQVKCEMMTRFPGHITHLSLNKQYTKLQTQECVVLLDTDVTH